MTVAVSKAVEDGAEAIICASTGNTSASAAAYAARAGIPALVLCPAGAVAGAEGRADAACSAPTMLEVRGSFDEALAAARELAARGTHALVNSVNPHRREGQKTAVFEIVEELGGAPDAFVVPYGGGGNTSAYAQALAESGLEAPIVSVEAADRQHTLATAIRIGEPAHAEAVLTSGAQIVTVSDDEIIEVWQLARRPRRALLRAVLGRRARCPASRRRRRRAASSSRSRATGSRTPRPPTATPRPRRVRSDPDSILSAAAALDALSR